MQHLNFTVIKGHQVASGRANDTRFPHGTIALQAPYFKMLGLDLNDYYFATINAKFDAKAVRVKYWQYQFKQVKWHAEFAPEDFSLSRCLISNAQQRYPALIYQPMASTKTEHFQGEHTLELIAPYIEGLNYGDCLTLSIAKNRLVLFK